MEAGSSGTTELRRWLAHAIRAGLFVAFVWQLYSVRYAPYRQEPFRDADETVRAINAGYPFQLLSPAEDGTPPVPKKMSEIYADYGINLVISVAGSAGRMLFGPSFQVDVSLARVILVLLFSLTAAAMLVPPVPLPVGIAGVLSMWALFEWGPIALVTPRHWGVAYVTLVAAVYLGTVLKPWTGPRTSALVLLAALAAYSQLLRQEAGPTVYVVGAALIASAAAAAAVSARHTAAEWDTAANLRQVAWRALGGGLLLVVANGAVQPVERFCFSRAWGTPFSETLVANHGAGWPLYLSLGYISNPFNIGWRDPIGQVHARLITPDLWYVNDAFQSTLLHEYVRIVISRPWLLIRNVMAKAARVHHLAHQPSAPSALTAISQSPQLARVYRAAPWALLGSLIIVLWRGTPEGVVIWFCSIALAAGASAGALVVFPEYLGGVQGASVALVVVLPAAIIGSAWGSSRKLGDASRSSTRRLLAGCAGSILAAAIVAAAFVAVQAWRYHQLVEATLRAGPIEAVAAQEFRYAHVFNDLSPAQQGRLVAAIQASRAPILARTIDDRRGDLDLFRPEVVLRTASQVHLIAWMGRTFQAPVPQLYQGATHALVFICGDCPSDATVNDFPFDSGWTMINDLEWQGRYRMFSMPMSAKLKAARFVHVAGEKVVALDSSIHATGLKPELIASSRFTF